MPIYVGGTEISNLTVGSTEVQEVYVGSTLIWSNQKIAPVPAGFVATVPSGNLTVPNVDVAGKVGLSLTVSLFDLHPLPPGYTELATFVEGSSRARIAWKRLTAADAGAVISAAGLTFDYGQSYAIIDTSLNPAPANAFINVISVSSGGATDIIPPSPTNATAILCHAQSTIASAQPSGISFSGGGSPVQATATANPSGEASRGSSSTHDVLNFGTTVTYTSNDAGSKRYITSRVGFG